MERLKNVFSVILGTHVLIGCVFTSALKSDSNVQHLLKEFALPASKDAEDKDSVLSSVN